MPSWDGGTDAITFRPSEWTTVDERPMLRVLWLPAGSASASFRNGVNGYTNTFDTRIRQGDPDVSATTATSVFVDAIAFSNTNNPDQVLIRFDNIVGTDPGQVPPGSRIDAAMLDIATVANSGYGDGGQFFAMLRPWQDTDTWNTLVDGIQTDGVEAATTATVSAGSATLNPNVCGGFMSFDVTPDVQTWSSGTRTNYGWAILPWPNGGDGWAVSMSESTEERERPRLRVFYTPGAAPVIPVIQNIQRTPSTAVITFSGSIGTQYSVLRSATVNGTYTPAGTATVQPGGTATFTDNSPLPGAAFYRISYP